MATHFAMSEDDGYFLGLAANVVFCIGYYVVNRQVGGPEKLVTSHRSTFAATFSSCWGPSDRAREQFHREYSEVVQRYAETGTWALLTAWLIFRVILIFRMLAALHNAQFAPLRGGYYWHGVDIVMGAALLLVSRFPRLHKVRGVCVSHMVAAVILIAFVAPVEGVTKQDLMVFHPANMMAFAALAPLSGPVQSTIIALLYNLVGCVGYYFAAQGSEACENEVSVGAYATRRMGVDLAVMLLGSYGAITFVAVGVQEAAQRKALLAESEAVSSLLRLACDAVVEVDKCGIVTSMPTSLHNHLLHMSEDSLKGVDLRQLLHTEGDRKRFSSFLEEQTSTRSSVRHLVMRDAMSAPVPMEVFKVEVSPEGSSEAKYLLGFQEVSDVDKVSRLATPSTSQGTTALSGHSGRRTPTGLPPHGAAPAEEAGGETPASGQVIGRATDDSFDSIYDEFRSQRPPSSARPRSASPGEASVRPRSASPGEANERPLHGNSLLSEDDEESIEDSMDTSVSSMASQETALPVANNDLETDEVAVWVRGSIGLPMIKCSPRFTTITGTIPAQTDLTSLCVPGTEPVTEVACQRCFQDLCFNRPPRNFKIYLKPPQMTRHQVEMVVQASMQWSGEDDLFGGQDGHIVGPGGQPLMKLLVVKLKLKRLRTESSSSRSGLERSSQERRMHDQMQERRPPPPPPPPAGSPGPWEQALGQVPRPRVPRPRVPRPRVPREQGGDIPRRPSHFACTDCGMVVPEAKWLTHEVVCHYASRQRPHGPPPLSRTHAGQPSSAAAAGEPHYPHTEL